MIEQPTIDRDEDPACGMNVERESARAKDLVMTLGGWNMSSVKKSCFLQFRDDPETFLDVSYAPSM